MATYSKNNPYAPTEIRLEENINPLLQGMNPYDRRATAANAWERAHGNAVAQTQPQTQSQATVNANATANAQRATQGNGNANAAQSAPEVTEAQRILNAIDKNRYVNQYNKYAEKTNATRNAYLKQLQDRYTADQATTNSTYDQAARQNYITYRQNQKNLAGELNSLGIRGGASESAAVRLNNAYGTNTATNNAARGTALAQLARNYADTTADYNRDIDNQLSQAYATALENQSRYEDEQRELARQEAIRQETLRRELEQQQYERQRYAEQVAREEARYQEEQARYRQERALEQFSATLERFTTPQQITATIESIDPNDPNAPAMVQLLQMRRAQIDANGGGSSSGGSSGGGGSRKKSSSKRSSRSSSSSSSSSGSSTRSQGNSVGNYYISSSTTGKKKTTTTTKKGDTYKRTSSGKLRK